MIIYETHYFTKLIKSLMSDELYSDLQEALVHNPELGDLIQGSGGLRKVRWRVSEKGKRGGVRVIYYWVTRKDHIFMLYAYPKNKSENITKQQVDVLRKLVSEELEDE